MVVKMKVYVPFKIDKIMLDLMIKKAESKGHTKSSYIRYLIERDAHLLRGDAPTFDRSVELVERLPAVDGRGEW